MTAYYNENDPYVAQWLRNLIAAGYIAPGDVDERDIRDVRADDLRGYVQCHFFAGIAGWSLALRMAGWPDDRSVWTGSCPCQPFSAVGQGKAADDERHLWPQWFSLIRECRPAIVFGEQVDAAIGWGWLDLIFADLEAESYACGAAVLPACGVGAPHIRNRLWFVAQSNGGDASAEGLQRGGEHRQQPENGCAVQLADTDPARCGSRRPSQARDGRDAARIESSGLCVAGTADAIGAGLEVEREQPARHQCATAERGGAASELADAQHAKRRAISGPVEDVGNGQDIGRTETHGEFGACCSVRELGNSKGDRWREIFRPFDQTKGGRESPRSPSWSGQAIDWQDCSWLSCTDGKVRPVEPGTFPLVARLSEGMGSDSSGTPSPFRTIKDATGRPIGQAPWRIGMLRGYGNAIVPQCAAEFIRAALDSLAEPEQR